MWTCQKEFLLFRNVLHIWQLLSSQSVRVCARVRMHNQEGTDVTVLHFVLSPSKDALAVLTHAWIR